MTLEHSALAKKFYNSKAWKDCRQSYLIKIHYICERCEGPAEIVHHKEYINIDNINDPNVTLNHDNLEGLCQTCHNKEHFGDSKPIREGLQFNANGELIEM